MKNYFLLKSSLIFFIAVGLTACGGTGQDKGKVADADITMSGAAVDGHLARATVFLDSNNNGTRDPWEIFAFTDNDGYYSSNPITLINYCAATATADQKQYCLRSRRSLASTSVVIRIDGGYDILTGEPFVGQLSRRITLSAGGTVPFSVISPLSSLLVDVPNKADQTAILNALDLSESDLDVDYASSDTSINSKLLNISLKIHKVVAVLADRLTDTYTKIGDDFGTPNDASASVYRNLAKEIISSSNNVEQILTSTQSLARVLDASENNLRDIYIANSYELPNDLGSATTPDQLARVTNVAAKINGLVNTLIPPEKSGLMQNDILGNTKALEAVVIKALTETNTPDSSIDNAVTFFTDVNNAALVNSLTTNLGKETGDIEKLTRNNFNMGDLDSVDKITQLVEIPSSVIPFSTIGGLRIRVSDDDLGQAPSALKDDEVEFYFKGSSNALNGEFSACAKHIKNANSNGTLGDGNTRGELIKGYWSLLGASESNMKSYSLLLTINFLGATYQAVIKPAEAVTVSNKIYKQYRFDYTNGKFTTFKSEYGLIPVDTIPTSSKECEIRLPSRVGI